MGGRGRFCSPAFFSVIQYNIKSCHYLTIQIHGVPKVRASFVFCIALVKKIDTSFRKPVSKVCFVMEKIVKVPLHCHQFADFPHVPFLPAHRIRRRAWLPLPVWCRSPARCRSWLLRSSWGFIRERSAPIPRACVFLCVFLSPCMINMSFVRPPDVWENVGKSAHFAINHSLKV